MQHRNADVRDLRRRSRAAMLRGERLADSEQQQLLLQPEQLRML
jgi:hypothetical protein